MDTANLERVEFLKGPASLLSGEGAAGGAINYVNKQPHTGPIRNEAYFSFDSLHSFRVRMVPAAAPMFMGWTIASTSAVRRSMALSTTPTPKC